MRRRRTRQITCTGCLLSSRTDPYASNIQIYQITGHSASIADHMRPKKCYEWMTLRNTDKANQSSSELLNRDSFARDLISILLPQLLHTGNEAYLVRLVALDAHAGHLHPYHHLGLHAFNPGKLASGQSRLDTRSIPYRGGILEAHLTRLGQVHHQLRGRFVVLIADDVTREEAWREVVLAQ